MDRAILAKASAKGCQGTMPRHMSSKTFPPTGTILVQDNSEDGGDGALIGPVCWDCQNPQNLQEYRRAPVPGPREG
eukprot:956446-Prorocentrum_lima.AAC.1